MALSDFFRINLPYGMQRNTQDEWFFFNREYMPLGWNQTTGQQSLDNSGAYSEFPVYTKYKGLSDTKILKIVKTLKAVTKDKQGEISRVYFYNDRTNPQIHSEFWEDYLHIIKELSKFTI